MKNELAEKFEEVLKQVFEVKPLKRVEYLDDTRMGYDIRITLTNNMLTFKSRSNEITIYGEDIKKELFLVETVLESDKFETIIEIVTEKIKNILIKSQEPSIGYAEVAFRIAKAAHDFKVFITTHVKIENNFYIKTCETENTCISITCKGDNAVIEVTYKDKEIELPDDVIESMNALKSLELSEQELNELYETLNKNI